MQMDCRGYGAVVWASLRRAGRRSRRRCRSSVSRPSSRPEANAHLRTHPVPRQPSHQRPGPFRPSAQCMAAHRTQSPLSSDGFLGTCSERSPAGRPVGDSFLGRVRSEIRRIVRVKPEASSPTPGDFSSATETTIGENIFAIRGRARRSSSEVIVGRAPDGASPWRSRLSRRITTAPDAR